MRAGWISRGERRLALLLPEQTSANNRGLCFSWYRPEDVRRGGGEAMSIRQMLRVAIKKCRSDPRRVFIAGFSAGGGMAAAMLAAYPAVFAAGGVVAGMPVGAARTQMQALLRMRRGNPLRLRHYLAANVRAAAPPRASRAWPRLSIWQGARDQTVDSGQCGGVGGPMERAARLGRAADDDGEGSTRRASAGLGAGRAGRRSSCGPWTGSGTAFRSIRMCRAAGGSGRGWPMPVCPPRSGWPAFWGVDGPQALSRKATIGSI